MAFDSSNWPKPAKPNGEANLRARYPHRARAFLLGSLVLSVAAGLVVAPPVTMTDPDLSRLMISTGLIKAMFIVIATGAALWRMGFRAPPSVLVGYSGALAATGLGFGLVWSFSLPLVSAVLLHGGFIALIALTLRDKILEQVFAGMLQRKRELQP